MISADDTNATSGIQYIKIPLSVSKAKYGTKEIVEIDGKRPLGVMFGDVVDGDAGDEAVDRGVRTSVIVEVDEAGQG